MSDTRASITFSRAPRVVREQSHAIYVAHEKTRDRCLYRSPFDRTVGLSSSLDTQQVREPAFASSFHRHSSLRASSCTHDCLLSLSSQYVAPAASPLFCFCSSSHSIPLALCLLFPPSVFSPSSLFLPPSSPIPSLFPVSCIKHSISAYELYVSMEILCLTSSFIRIIWQGF